MSTGVVAASAAAVAMYWYLFKQKGIKDDAMERVWPNEACRNAPDHAPSNWGEALYHVKEVLRYMYNETLGRWHTVDLFVGLAYLSHRETVEYPAADIVAKGTPLGLDCSIPEQIKLMLELQEARRYMLYCKGLKLRREEMQSRFWKEHLGADTLTIMKQQPTAGVLRPAYVVINDHALRCVVLCIRGTHSMKDLFTSLAGAAKPHHVVDPDSGQPVLGYSHLGMLAAARWLARQATPVLRMALEASPGYQLRIVGHSMGGGAAALLTMMYRGGLLGTPTTSGQGVNHTHIHSPRPNQGPVNTTSSAASAAAGAGLSISTTTTTAAAAVATSSAGASATDSDPFLTARCVAIACPSVVTLELAAACREYVTSIIHGTDIVPTFCAASVDKLREDVTRSSWFSEFSRDMRSGVIRALQGGVRGVGTATQWTSRNILQPAVVPFRACYATTTTRKVRRRAASSIAQSTGTVAGAAAAAAAVASGGAAFNSNVGSSAPSASNFAQLSMAEQHEQLLLAGGPGGGAAAAAAAVAALEGSPLTRAPGNVLPHSTSAGMLEEWGPPGLGLGEPARPPGTQSMASVGRQRAGGGASGVDQRAMAEAVQSCIYAVNSAVSAHHHHHHHHQQQGSSPASDPALAEALGLLESLPSELGPGTAAAGAGDRMGAPELGHVIAHNQFQHHHHPVVHQRSLEALDAADPRRRPAATAGAGGAGGAGPSSTQAADSLFAGPTAAPLGASGVSTAMVYGNSLRRRFWPWGQSQQQDGGSSGGCADGSTGPAATATAAAGLGAAGGSGQAGMCLPIGGGGMGFGAAGNGPGLGSASGGGSYSSLCEQEGSGGGCGGVGSMAPHRMDAPDSPGKAKAKAVPQGGMVSGGMAALASTRVIGDWLWGGMLFSTCTAPRRAMTAGPAALGSAAAGPGAARGGGNAGRAATRGSGSGALLMDVGDGFDDESDPDERGAARQRRRRRSVVEQHGSSAEGDEEEDHGLGSEGEDAGDSADDDEEEDDEDDDEEGGIGVSGVGRVRDGGSGVGGDGTQSAAGAADSEQQLQAGITAVVAAVTNQATREAVEGPTALLRDENTLAAEAVLREVREADAAAADAASGAGSTNNSRTRRRHGEETLRRREPRRGHVDDGAAGITGKSSVRGVRDIGASDGAGVATSAASGHSAADPRVIGREASEGALGHGVEEEDEAPLSPGGSTINSPIGGGHLERSGISAAEYEARLYKRRLYPAGRILHLLPGCAISGQRPATAAAVQGSWTGGGAGSSSAAAACTNPIDATAARVSAVQAPHVLYEVRDPQAYSRVRLCRTMVSDHLIPAYLTALDSVLSQMEERQQRAAMDAWERELELDRHQQPELHQQQQRQQWQQNEQEERQ